MNEVSFNKNTIYDTNVIIRLYSYTFSDTYRRMTITYSLHYIIILIVIHTYEWRYRAVYVKHILHYTFYLFSSNIFDAYETGICFACGTYFLHYILNTLTKICTFYDVYSSQSSKYSIFFVSNIWFFLKNHSSKMLSWGPLRGPL